jgi:DNA-binding response OmpR family regulator
MYLEQDGFTILTANDGEAALEVVFGKSPDLVVLDLMLPKLNGWEVCKRVRAESDVPIIMLTARDDDIDKIVGLELGADDYMTKPFNPRELVARVKAILRRTAGGKSEHEAEVARHIGDLTIDPARREVRVKGEEVELRSKEFDLLYVLVENAGLALSREQLLSMAWGFDFYGQTRTVDVHVAHVRKKLEDRSSTLTIETVWGHGYKLVTL